MVGDYSFTSSIEDLALLAALGAVGSQVGTPFLAAADPGLLGGDSAAGLTALTAGGRVLGTPSVAWDALRHSSVARWIGLALPRMLLRLPYGPRTDPTEAFDFEEMPPDRDAESYLWGNPAFACALLAGTAFMEQGWSLQLGDRLEIDDLPAHTYESAGESQLQACAEVYLGDRVLDAVLARGVMPLSSAAHRGTVRLARFQSVADPPQALAGSWNRA
jgi:type VI secretion system protein ImpC